MEKRERDRKKKEIKDFCFGEAKLQVWQTVEAQRRSALR